MQANDNSERGEGPPIADAWWAALAADLLHPVQVQVIEALRYIGEPLSVGDISEIVLNVEPVHLDYHVGRLRRLGVLDCRPTQPGGGFMDVRCALVAKRERRGRH